MSTITTSEALSRFIQNKTFEVEVGAVRPATLMNATNPPSESPDLSR